MVNLAHAIAGESSTDFGMVKSTIDIIVVNEADQPLSRRKFKLTSNGQTINVQSNDEGVFKIFKETGPLNIELLTMTQASQTDTLQVLKKEVPEKDDKKEEKVETKSGTFTNEEINIFAALIFAESSGRKENEKEKVAIGYVFKGKLDKSGKKSIKAVAESKSLYGSVTGPWPGHNLPGSREYRAFLGVYEENEKTDLKGDKAPKTMEEYAKIIKRDHFKYHRCLALEILNEKIDNPVPGAIGQGGMKDFYYDYPKKDKNGKYKYDEKAKYEGAVNSYWLEIRKSDPPVWVQIGDSVFIWKTAEERNNAKPVVDKVLPPSKCKEEQPPSTTPVCEEEPFPSKCEEEQTSPNREEKQPPSTTPVCEEEPFPSKCEEEQTSSNP